MTDHHIKRAVDEQTDKHPRFDSARRQNLRHTRRAFVQFFVGQGLVAELKRNRIRCALDLFSKQIVNAQLTRIIRLRLIPIHEQLVALGFIQ